MERFVVETKPGPLEVLYAAPGNGQPARSSPLFFVHGGMGGAWVWLEYMQYFAQHGIASYAVSLRGHGRSWHPAFFRMVFGTTRRDLVDDLLAGIRWAQDRERGEPVVLVGHSSGGGLSQYILSEGDVRVRALALLGAVPGFGSYVSSAGPARAPSSAN